MKKIIMSLFTFIAFSSFGTTNKTQRSQIMCWPDSFDYASDSIETRSETHTKIEGTETQNIKEQSSANKEEGNIGVKGKVEGSIGPYGPTGKVTFESAAEYEKRFQKNASDQTKSVATAAENSKEHAIFTSHGKNLQLCINLRNKSTQTFRYEPGQCSGLFLKIKDISNNGKYYKLPVEIKDMKPNKFDLNPNGGMTILHVKAAISNVNHKVALLTIQNTGEELDKYVTIEFDDNFSLKDTSNGDMWNYHNLCVCKIATIGFGMESPVIVNSYGLNYKKVLEEATKEICENKDADYGFKFDNDGNLSRVYKNDFGKFASDDNGVYVILAEIHGKFKDRLSSEELAQKLSSKEIKHDLNFKRVGLAEIFLKRKMCPDTVISNCFSFVRNNSDIPDDDLLYCAMLAKDKRDYELYRHCLFHIRDLKGCFESNGSKSEALSLIIRADNVEHFKKLNPELAWNYTERTKLGWAAEIGALNIVKHLLEEMPVHDRPTVDELVDDADGKTTGPKGKTPLFWAAKNGHLEVCRYLVLKGADLNRKFYEMEDKTGNKMEYDELLDESYVKDSRVRDFIKAQREVLDIGGSRSAKTFWSAKPECVTKEKLREWIDANVLPDSYLGCHWNLLSWAVELKDCDLVELLVDKGADVNGEYAATPKDKRTALMLACEVGNTNLVEKLISKGANLHACQEGAHKNWNAFDCAMVAGKVDCARILARYNESWRKFLRLYDAAEGGNPAAQNELGRRYLKGTKDIPRDYSKAVEWLRKSADQNFADAWYNLSLCYSYGWGVDKDSEEAEKCIREARELGCKK